MERIGFQFTEPSSSPTFPPAAPLWLGGAPLKRVTRALPFSKIGPRAAWGIMVHLLFGGGPLGVHWLRSLKRTSVGESVLRRGTGQSKTGKGEGPLCPPW